MVWGGEEGCACEGGAVKTMVCVFGLGWRGGCEEGHGEEGQDRLGARRGMLSTGMMIACLRSEASCASALSISSRKLAAVVTDAPPSWLTSSPRLWKMRSRE